MSDILLELLSHLNLLLNSSCLLYHQWNFRRFLTFRYFLCFFIFFLFFNLFFNFMWDHLQYKIFLFFLIFFFFKVLFILYCISRWLFVCLLLLSFLLIQIFIELTEEEFTLLLKESNFGYTNHNLYKLLILTCNTVKLTSILHHQSKKNKALSKSYPSSWIINPYRCR